MPEMLQKNKKLFLTFRVLGGEDCADDHKSKSYEEGRLWNISENDERYYYADKRRCSVKSTCFRRAESALGGYVEENAHAVCNRSRSQRADNIKYLG